MFEHVKDLADLVGIRAIADSRKITYQIEASYLATLNHCVHLRLVRTAHRMRKSMGEGYYKTHARDEALELVQGFVEAWHGFPKPGSVYLHINSDIYDRTKELLKLVCSLAHPESHEMLGHADMQLLIELTDHYLTTQTCDFTLRLKGSHVGWTREAMYE